MVTLRLGQWYNASALICDQRSSRASTNTGTHQKGNFWGKKASKKKKVSFGEECCIAKKTKKENKKWGVEEGYQEDTAASNGKTRRYKPRKTELRPRGKETHIKTKNSGEKKDEGDGKKGVLFPGRGLGMRVGKRSRRGGRSGGPKCHPSRITRGKKFTMQECTRGSVLCEEDSGGLGMYARLDWVAGRGVPYYNTQWPHPGTKKSGEGDFQ